MTTTRRILLLTALAGCSRTPEPSLFILAAIPGEAHPGGPATIELRRLGVAGYLDRPEIIRAAGPYRVGVAGAERWAEPFDDMVGRVLAENLTRRLPGSAIFTEAGGLSVSGDAVLEVDVQRFDADALGVVTLLAQVAVRRNGSRRPAPPPQTVQLTVPAVSITTLDTVAAMSQALGQLADTIARLLRGI